MWIQSQQSLTSCAVILIFMAKVSTNHKGLMMFGLCAVFVLLLQTMKIQLLLLHVFVKHIVPEVSEAPSEYSVQVAIWVRAEI